MKKVSAAGIQSTLNTHRIRPIHRIQTGPAAMFRHLVPTELRCGQGQTEMASWVEGTSERLNNWYRQFVAIDPPPGSGALRAWKGGLCPFPDDSELGTVLAHLERGEVVRVEEGGRLMRPLDCPDEDAPAYAHDLTTVSVAFELLLLDFGPKRNPRVYGVRPEISRRTFPDHPHLRDDQLVFWEGRPIPPLCAYLASDGVLARDEMRLVHVLDFTSFFLAKHLVWCRTAKLWCVTGDRPSLLAQGICAYRPALSRQTFDGVHRSRAAFYRTDCAPQDHWKSEVRTEWAYHWPGPTAPHFIDHLVDEIPRQAECPCGTGEAYKNCCRPDHVAGIAR